MPSETTMDSRGTWGKLSGADNSTGETAFTPAQHPSCAETVGSGPTI
jgi:hypothetical protein